ncbi:cytochrome c1 [Halomonas hibernica]|uniref:cytochrome c1 n=1 Tax=Halomonas hibernica TaxID=2591147 RepID=UPI0015544266|nr:cytochrome c1 [Halomonas hibernica]
MKKYVMALFLWLLPMTATAQEEARNVTSMSPDLQDRASLQNGLKLYVNYCLGCHTLSYQRFSRTADDLGIPEALMKDSVMFSSGLSFNDAMHNALSDDDAAQWWGAAPPDLSLTTRLRGVDWVYSFLLGFYRDPARPTGVNNTVYESVAMPNVLEPLQGVQELDCRQARPLALGGGRCQQLSVTAPGELSSEAFEEAVYDITNFLAYVGEPSRLKAQSVGPKILFFIFIFSVFAYLLKREYWKDIR